MAYLTEVKDVDNRPCGAIIMNYMNKGRVISRISLLAAAGLIFFAIFSFLNKTTTFCPGGYNEPFPDNPFKGWVVWGSSPQFEQYTQPYSMIFAKVRWAEVEPERGDFQWEAFEDKWHFDAATGNRKMILRVVLDDPRRQSVDKYKEIPHWLYDAIDGSGLRYDTSEIGNGLSPDYSTPALIKEHERFIKALGERYNNDPRIAFIQLGSLGHWGEWHTWPEGSGRFPDYAVAGQYVKHYMDAFPDKILLARRPLKAHSVKADLGLYNDVIGDNSLSGTPSWLEMIADGYTSTWDKETHPPLEADWWKRRCSAGELRHHANGIEHWLSDENYDSTLQQIRDSHTSWIGPGSPGKIKNSSDYQYKIDKLLKNLGYRYAIEELTYRNRVKAGKAFFIDLLIQNTGTAPVYYSWPLEFSLIDDTGEIVYRKVISSMDIRDWLPGANRVTLSVMIPGHVISGRYNFAVAILNPDNPDGPGISLAIDQGLKRPDGKYVLGEISISGT